MSFICYLFIRFRFRFSTEANCHADKEINELLMKYPIQSLRQIDLPVVSHQKIKSDIRISMKNPSLFTQ